MSRLIALTVALAASVAGVQAQTMGTANPEAAPDVQSQPAPVVRAYPRNRGASGGYAPGLQEVRNVSQVTQSQPIPGVVLWVAADGSVKTVSADAKGTELRVEHGRANISVHQPAQNSELLVDLPGGQVSLLKDGLYTFNADTDTVRVLKGEADAYPGPIGPGVKGIKVKEFREVVFSSNASSVRAVDVNPPEAGSDLLPMGGYNGEPARGYGYPGYGYAGYGYPGYGYGPYGGYFGYPYYPGYAWGYPGWGFGFGFGVGFGYYGGFRGGYGYRGYYR